MVVSHREMAGVVPGVVPAKYSARNWPAAHVAGVGPVQVNRLTVPSSKAG
jgi:hypothetical protein